MNYVVGASEPAPNLCVPDVMRSLRGYCRSVAVVY